MKKTSHSPYPEELIVPLKNKMSNPVISISNSLTSNHLCNTLKEKEGFFYEWHIFQCFSNLANNN